MIVQIGRYKYINSQIYHNWLFNKCSGVGNAFENTSWQCTLDALRARHVDSALLNTFASYLSDRGMILKTENITRIRSVNSGVMNEDLLKMPQPRGAKLIGFADDFALVVEATREKSLMSIGNLGLLRTAKWMEGRKLRLALNKTELVLLIAKRKLSR